MRLQLNSLRTALLIQIERGDLLSTRLLVFLSHVNIHTLSGAASRHQRHKASTYERAHN